MVEISQVEFSKTLKITAWYSECQKKRVVVQGTFGGEREAIRHDPFGV